MASLGILSTLYSTKDRSMKNRVFAIVVAAFFALSSAGCRREGHDLNEGLRLSEGQLQTCKEQALHGDAAAAKKLWHHYSFVEMNENEGEKWKILYDKLDQTGSHSGNIRPTSPAPISTPPPQ